MPDIAQQKKHIHQVDYIRAIASMAVALFHLGGKVLPGLKYGWLGVYMFFLLSGFIVCHAIPAGYSWNMAGRFISKRVIRIEPAYLISIALVLLVNFVSVANYHPLWMNVFSHLAYINNFSGEPYLSPVYWTLGIEFQFYLFVALCLPIIAGKWGPWFILILCGAFYFINISGSTLTGVFPVFGLGMLYFRYFTNKTSAVNAVLLSLPVIFCSIMRVGWLQTGAVLFALVLLLLPLKANRVIGFFSKISFSLYLTHDAIGSTLVVFMGRHLPKTFMYKGVEFISGIIVSILFACLFYWLIERPFFKLSKRIKYPLNTSALAT
jgi:peptidoglycan/LPS O-acetylase OafA/YrhL